ETVTLKSSGATYTLATSNPTITVTGAPANFTNGPGNTGTITALGLTGITINDTLQTGPSDESVVFADSGPNPANAYTTDFTVNLAQDHASCDSLVFNGSSMFSSATGLAATVARGNITSDTLSSVMTTGGAPLSLTATAGNISMLGVVNVSGLATLTAG